jgi:hypothetical protein
MHENDSAKDNISAISGLSDPQQLQNTVEIVAERMGLDQTVAPTEAIETALLPDSQYRKIFPSEQSVDTNPLPHFITAELGTDSQSFGGNISQFISRLTGFFMPGGAQSQDTSLVQFHNETTSVEGTDAATAGKKENLEDTIDRLENAQNFTVGMSLMSSLTQTVMSSTRRLTQGQ